MKILKAQQPHPKKIVVAIEDLTFIKTMTALREIMQGDKLLHPIQINKHTISDRKRLGAGGAEYVEKKFSVWKGSQRVQAAKSLGYTHIEAIILNDTN